MTQEATLVPSPHVVTRIVGEETVLLDLASGTYFSLDPVGTRIWQLIEDGKPVPQIITTMLDEYDVERQRLETDVGKLVAELIEKQLVTSG